MLGFGNKGITKPQNSKTKHQNTVCDPNPNPFIEYSPVGFEIKYLNRPNYRP